MGNANDKDISASSSDENNKTSLLPENVQAILQRGMSEGIKHPVFGDGYLGLRDK